MAGAAGESSQPIHDHVFGQMLDQVLSGAIEGALQPMTLKAYLQFYNMIHTRLSWSVTPLKPAPDAAGAGCNFAEFVRTESLAKFQAHCTSVRRHLRAQQGVLLLHEYLRLWDTCLVQSKVLGKICDYYNRFFAIGAITQAYAQHAGAVNAQGDAGGFAYIRLPLNKLMIWVWSQELAMHVDMKPLLFAAAFSLLQAHREGQGTEHDVIRRFTACLVTAGVGDGLDTSLPDMSVYQIFQDCLLVDTASYYERQAAIFLERNSVSAYLTWAYERMVQEAELCDLCLHPSSREEVIRTCDGVMVQRYMETLKAEFVTLLCENRERDIRSLFKLLVPYDAEARLATLQQQMKAFVQAQGHEALQSVCPEVLKDSTGQVFFDQISRVYDANAQLVRDALDNHALFKKAVDDACSNFINVNCCTKASQRRELSAELLARYCDTLLKRADKDGDVERSFDRVITVFKYLEDKDVFQTFYANMLAKRLITKRSSDELESAMIARLRTECGFEYVQRLQRMYADVRLSDELNAKYKDYLRVSQHAVRCDATFQILTCGSWPFNPRPMKLALLEAVSASVDHFAQFYKAQYQGRQLSWLWKVCTADVKATCMKKPYVLTCSALQMVVLHYFNNATTGTLSDISAATSIEPKLLAGVMEIFKSVKLILETDGIFSLNLAFKSDKLRVNINKPLREEKVAEVESVHAEVAEERKLILQATIVRIMKTRKVRVLHTALHQEVIDQVKNRFQPDIRMIKKQIDTLIEKEYMKRNDDDPLYFDYVA